MKNKRAVRLAMYCVLVAAFCVTCYFLGRHLELHWLETAGMAGISLFGACFGWYYHDKYGKF